MLGTPAAILLAGCQAFNGGMWTAWPYLRWALEVVRGYTEVAAMPGPVWQLGLLLLFWAVLFALPLMDAGLGCFRHPAWWCALLHAFQGFKHGMVRQDGHADLSMARLAVCAFFLLATVREQAYRKALVLLAVFGCAFTWVHMSEVRQLHFRRASAYFTPGGIAATVRDLAHYPARYLEVGSRSREIRSSLVLGEAFHARVGRGSVDAFPDQIDTIRANGWRYVPRPTIDAITAFTQSMNQFNARHMQGERAPEFMLFYFAAIDGRHPMLQDTGTLRAMFERYDLVERGPMCCCCSGAARRPGCSCGRSARPAPAGKRASTRPRFTRRRCFGRASRSILRRGAGCAGSCFEPTGLCFRPIMRTGFRRGTGCCARSRANRCR